MLPEKNKQKLDDVLRCVTEGIQATEGLRVREEGPALQALSGLLQTPSREARPAPDLGMGW